MSKYLRTTYRVIKKISPSFASVCAGIYCGITGWRFDDLKKHLSQLKQKNNLFTLRYTCKKFDRPEQNRPRLAFISPLPPEETGIASCTFYTFKNSSEPIDIYTQPKTEEDLLLMDSYLGRNVEVMDASLTILGLEKMKYDKIIIALGNSPHHYYVHDIIKKIVRFNLQDKFIIYLHDPFLNNFIQSGLGYSNGEYVKELAKIYNLDENTTKKLNSLYNFPELQEALVQEKIFGIKWLYDKGFKHFLVNSEAARNFIYEDIGNQVDNGKVKIDRIFHPVFKASVFGSESDYENIYLESISSPGLKIGSFGLPGRGKCTELIIEAVKLLKVRHPEIKLVLAGYALTDYFRKFPELREDFIEVFDSPSDRLLNYIMDQVDVAVQLRLSNLGESSGVVPQLLGRDKKVICSPIGSFNEYGDAVTFFPGKIAKELAKTIEKALEEDSAQKIRQYCAERTPQKFCEKLHELYA